MTGEKTLVIGNHPLTPRREVIWTPPEGYTVFKSGLDYCVLEKNDTKEFVVYGHEVGVFKPVFSVEDMEEDVNLYLRTFGRR